MLGERERMLVSFRWYICSTFVDNSRHHTLSGELSHLRHRRGPQSRACSGRRIETQLVAILAKLPSVLVGKGREVAGKECLDRSCRKHLLNAHVLLLQLKSTTPVRSQSMATLVHSRNFEPSSRTAAARSIALYAYSQTGFVMAPAPAVKTVRTLFGTQT